MFKGLSWILICLCNHRNYIELKPLISIQICLKWLIYLLTIYARLTVWQVFTCDSYTWPDKASRQYESRLWDVHRSWLWTYIKATSFTSLLDTWVYGWINVGNIDIGKMIEKSILLFSATLLFRHVFLWSRFIMRRFL